MAKEKIKILLVAGEAVPFAKVGGLADVVGALGKELHENGLDVRVVIPKYTIVYDFIEKNHIKVSKSQEFSISMERGEINGKVEEVSYNGVRFYLIDNPDYFKRDGIYTDNSSKYDFPDSLERFTFFCKAVLEASKLMDFKPHIVHANDWQVGLIPVYLKTIYKLDSFFKNTKVVFTIHNLSYQGIFPVEQFTITGLDWKYFTINSLEYYGHVNLMKGGIVFSDMVITVSETYASEIQSPEYGNGLEGVIRDKAMYKRIVGIVHGVDYQEWNPAVDTYLKEKYALNYDYNTIENKTKIKEKFLLENGVKNPDLSIPMIGVVSRLVDQKGFDLIFEIMDNLLRQNVYLTVLGTGKNDYENRLRAVMENNSGRAFIFIGFDIMRSHLIEAASDIYLMPSRFEPCGLNQLYSLRYGTIPVVRKTGGLADTVKDGKTGFVFHDYNPDDLMNKLKEAITTYREQPKTWKKFVENAMKEDWSWNKATKKYIDTYERLLEETENA